MTIAFIWGRLQLRWPCVLGSYFIFRFWILTF